MSAVRVEPEASEITPPAPLWATADACLRCTTCLSVCPALEVYPHYAGPKRLGPDRWRQQVDAEGRFRTALVEHDLDLCLGCRRCDQACPQGVAPERLITRTRLQRPSYRRPLRYVPRDWLLGHADWLGKVGTTFAGLANPLLPTRPMRFLLQHGLGLSGQRRLPAFARVRFSALPLARQRATTAPAPAAGLLATPAAGEDEQAVRAPAGNHYNTGGGLPGQAGNEPEVRDRVVYFPGCQVEYYEPELGERIVSLLEKLEVEVRIDRPACCGLPLVANGWTRAARRRAQENVERLIGWVDAGYTILVTSPSCALTLQTDYLDLSLLPPSLIDAGRRLSSHLLELGDYLLRWERVHGGRLMPTGAAEGAGLRGAAEAAGVGPARQRPAAEVPELAYHTPCHGWSEKEGRPWLQLLRRLPNVRVIDLSAGCCGIAGTYGLKQEKYAASLQIGSHLQQSLSRWARPLVATECETCRMQIAHLTPQAVVRHPLYWLGDLEFKETAQDEA